MLRTLQLRSLGFVIVMGFWVPGVAAFGQTASQPVKPPQSAPCPADCPPVAAGAVHRPCVKLTWKASVPASQSQNDKVIGYWVYRSEKSGEFASPPINSQLCSNTADVDTNVTPGKTYFYVVTGMSSVKESGHSNQAPASIP